MKTGCPMKFVTARPQKPLPEWAQQAADQAVADAVQMVLERMAQRERAAQTKLKGAGSR